jgi:hypothetical protein
MCTRSNKMLVLSKVQKKDKKDKNEKENNNFILLFQKQEVVDMNFRHFQKTWYYQGLIYFTRHLFSLVFICGL